MLVVTVKRSETISIEANGITVLVKIVQDGSKVKLGVDAPKEVRIVFPSKEKSNT